MADAEACLTEAEHRHFRDAASPQDEAQRAYDLIQAARQAGYRDHDHLQLRLAQALLLLGRPSDAVDPAYVAATARPYDVDSRVTHGRVRLALGHLAEAEHEFASVLEEFGGDADANAGLRAAHLAQGRLPLLAEDEVEVGADRDTGARLLIACWELAGDVPGRLIPLRDAGPDPGLVPLLERAARARDAARSR
jgi:tetratricopeptide (TPR) repeat protein